MKRANHFHGQITSFENLALALQKAVRGKRGREATGRFLIEQERYLTELKGELESGSYQPGGYSFFEVRDPKRRMIAAAPFRDRVVHHALMNVIEPLFERGFLFDSYACRKGKGTHRAVDRFTHYARRFPYVLKGDIVRYFPSIDHETLMGRIERRISCERTLDLIRKIVSSMRCEDPVYCPGDDLFAPHLRPHGLPIGNLTSQFFGNVYLDGFDHFVKEQLHAPGYIRYVDDFVVFGRDKGRLGEILAKAREYLLALCLHVHERKSRVYRVTEGIDFLGYRVWPTYRRLRRSNVIHFRRRLRKLKAAYARGDIPLSGVRARLQSWIAHASHANTHGLRAAIFRDTIFAKAG